MKVTMVIKHREPKCAAFRNTVNAGQIEVELRGHNCVNHRPVEQRSEPTAFFTADEQKDNLASRCHSPNVPAPATVCNDRSKSL